MAIRLDPRRLSALKQLAGEASMRPGELVTSWVEERIDAARGVPPVSPAARPAAEDRREGPVSAQAFARLAERVEALTARLDALADAREKAGTRAATASAVEATPAVEATTAVPQSEPVKKRRGRPPKNAVREAAPATAADDGELEAAGGAPATARKGGARRSSATSRPRAAGRRVPLHQAIIAAITEHGPMSAAEIADAIGREGSYQAPRTDKPLDAATVNSRVSNPVYRSLFRRDEGRIALAQQ
jgi:hypothetical protein